MQKLLLKYLRNFPIDYGKSRLSKKVKLPLDKPIVQYTNKHGISFELNINEYQMKQIYLYDLYEKNTILHLLRLINSFKKNDLVLFDIGANIGFYSLTLAKNLETTNSVIHCFEPNPFTYEALMKNISMNKFKNIIPNKIGLSDKEETLTLSYNEKNLGAANVFSGSGKNSTEIKLITLDSYCREHNIEKIDLIKVDIEGSELNFLKGGENIINRSDKLLVIMEIVDENCIKAGYKSIELFNFMMDRGFKAYLPKPWPFKLKQITTFPENYHDNIFFLKGIKI